MLYRTFDDLHDVMPWDAIDTAVFDVGNVLVGFSPENLLRQHLPDGVEAIFISAVSGLGIMELKDKIWERLQ